jgi:DNA-binding transcriptional LysR family regulator
LEIGQPIGMDTLLSMRAFAKVVESGNFTEAARRLKLSPAMVTKHVQSLEQRIGSRLLNRTPRNISLTEVGATYYERCVALLADVEEAEAAAGALGKTPRGHLRVSVRPAFGTAGLVPLVNEFMRTYPDITVDLVLTRRFANLIEEQFDVAVRIVESHQLEPTLLARKLASSRMVLCGSPDYFAKAGVPKHPDDLKAHRCLAYSEGDFFEDWPFSKNAKTLTVKTRAQLESNDVRLLCEAAAEGAGLTIQPTCSVWQYVKERQLVTVLDDWRIHDVGVYLIFPERRFIALKTRLFIDFMVAQFPGGPDRDPWGDATFGLSSERKERTAPRGGAKGHA